LGSAVVERLLSVGAFCRIPCHDVGELERCSFKGDPRVSIETGIDLTNEEDVLRLYNPFASTTYGSSGPLWASIHIAGGFAMGPATEVTKAQFVSMMQMNALTCFLCCREAARRMKAYGKRDTGNGTRDTANGNASPRIPYPVSRIPTSGRLVNVGARPGLIPELGAGMVPYTASKAAVLAVTQALAAELAPDGIWVNAIVPSIMDTPANRKAMPAADPTKWATVAGVAATIAFLASPQNQTTRGACVPVYAGG
jgi:NAD(P)-dependent dehydrogenase (short-subunit alcohol dehydrogenase family)